jgi:hypothetical protein
VSRSCTTATIRIVLPRGAFTLPQIPALSPGGAILRRMKVKGIAKAIAQAAAGSTRPLPPLVSSFSRELRFDHIRRQAMFVAQDLHHFE